MICDGIMTFKAGHMTDMYSARGNNPRNDYCCSGIVYSPRKAPKSATLNLTLTLTPNLNLTLTIM